MNTAAVLPRPMRQRKQSRVLRFILRGLGVFVLLTILAYAITLGWLYFRQEQLLFAPRVLPADYAPSLEGVVERKLKVPGATLSALHFRQPDAKGVVFFLHGNGGNVSSWLTSTELYRQTGYDVFMIDYRGYGKSTGHIENEAQLLADVRAAWDYIAPEYAGRVKVIYGRSLGTGPATWLATQVKADQLVLVSPYRSLLQIANEQYPWVPDFVMRYPMHTDFWLPKVHMPTLILHGARDGLIKVSNSQALKALKPDATLVILPDAKHADIHNFARYIELLTAKLEGLRAAETPATTQATAVAGRTSGG